MQFLKWTSSSLLVIFLCSCDVKKNQRTQHDPAVPSKTESADTGNKSEVDELKAMRQALASNSGDARVLGPLSAEVLDVKNLSDGEKTGSLNFKTKLSLLNEALLGLSQKDFQEAYAKSYENAIFRGCNAGLEGCQNVSFFKSDPLSSKILQRLAKQETDIEKKYRFLMMAYELKNSTADTDLDAAYAENAKAYEEKIKDQKELLKKHSKIVALLVQAQKNKSTDSKWLLDNGGWKVRRQEGAGLTTNVESLLKTLTRDHLYKDKEKKVLSDNFQKVLQETQAQPESFSQHLNRLNREAPQMLGRLKIKSVVQDEYFFMVDRVFAEAVSPQDMETVFAGSTQSLDRLKETAVQYVQTEMAHVIDLSNRELYAKINEKGSVLEDLLNRAIDHSAIIQVRVIEFSRKAHMVYQLVDLAHTSRGKNLDAGTRDLFEGLKRNIKYSLTYPQMLALSYYLAKRDFVQKLVIFIWTFDISSSEILQKIFNGDYPPWFNYGHDGNPLTPYEMILAFEMALKTGVFDIFHVPVEEFVHQIYSKLTLLTVRSLITSEAFLKGRFSDSNWELAQKMCEVLPQAPHIEQKLHIDKINKSPLGELAEQMLSGQVDIQALSMVEQYRSLSDLAGLKAQFFPYNLLVSRQLEEIRLTNLPFLRRAKYFNKAFRDHLLAVGTSESDIEKKMAFATKPLKELEKAQSGFVSNFTRISKKFDPCVSKVMTYENSIKMRVFHYETQYLKKIHQFMKQLRSQPSEALKIELNKKAKYYSIPQLAGYSVFDESVYRYAAADLYLRIKKYYEEGLHFEGIDLPLVNPGVQVVVPSKKENSTLLSNNRSIEVNWDDSEDVFVRNALSIFSDRRGAEFFNWYNLSLFQAPEEAASWFGTLAILYLLPNTSQDSSENINVEDLVQIPFRAYEALGISPQEERWMNFIGVQEKVPSIVGLQNHFLDSKDLTPRPPHEFLFQVFSEDYMGFYDNRKFVSAGADGQSQIQTRPTILKPFFGEMREYYLMRTSEEKFVFGVSKDSLKEMDDEFRQDMKTYETKIETLKKAVEERFNKDRQNGTLLEPSYRPESRYSGPYFGAGWVKSIDSRIYKFHEETKGFFESK